MATKVIRPSTLDGIKRLAKSIKTERGIKHIQALDAAAQAAGFENLRHARRCLESKAPPSAHETHRLFISAYWRVDGQRGRETVTVDLPVHWTDLISSSQLRGKRSLGDFRVAASDHLERRNLLREQRAARQVVCHVARMFQFMQATRLQPSTGNWRKVLGGVALRDMLPGADHSSIWKDPKTSRYLLVDEPYGSGTFLKAGEREAWAKKQGFIIAEPEWKGMYAPHVGSRLYLVSHSEKGVPIIPLLNALKALTSPIGDAPWTGESGPMVPPLLTPGTVTRATETKSERRQPARPSGPRKTVGYVQIFGGPQRRPKGRMPIEAHEEIGAVLKMVYADSYYRHGVRSRLDIVRSELDEWVQREYTHAELSNERFGDLYYHEVETGRPLRSIPSQKARSYVDRLQEVRTKLASYYPECAPLKRLLKHIDQAVVSMRKWGEKSKADFVESPT